MNCIVGKIENIHIYCKDLHDGISTMEVCNIRRYLYHFIEVGYFFIRSL